MSAIQWGFEILPRAQTAPLFKQVHGSGVVELPSTSPLTLQEADAGFTRKSGVRVSVLTADCLPVLLYSDALDSPIAAIHAGWRGALRGVVQETVRRAELVPRQTHAVLGPCIGQCCFEVKDDFIAAFKAQGRPVDPYLREHEGRWFCDLVGFVLGEELREVASIDQTHNRCTVCTLPLLPSYRRNGKADPSIRSWIERV